LCIVPLAVCYLCCCLLYRMWCTGNSRVKAGDSGTVVPQARGVCAGGFVGHFKAPCCWMPPAGTRGLPQGLLQRPLPEPQTP
jgi:hypothetical protein